MSNREFKRPEYGLNIFMYKAGMSENVYDVTLKYGVWPSKDALINICDGAEPEIPNGQALHKGGEVQTTGWSTKTVTVKK